MLKKPPFFTLPELAQDENDTDKGIVRTQMVGESAGDDLGYDPSQIPVEDIPDED